LYIVVNNTFHDLVLKKIHMLIVVRF
jgi:hypothetical protein